MKPNTRLRLEQGFLIVIILIVVGLVVRGHKQTENLAALQFVSLEVWQE